MIFFSGSFALGFAFSISFSHFNAHRSFKMKMCIEHGEFRAHCYANRENPCTFTFVSKNRMHSTLFSLFLLCVRVACSFFHFWNTHFFTVIVEFVDAAKRFHNAFVLHIDVNNNYFSYRRFYYFSMCVSLHAVVVVAAAVVVIFFRFNFSELFALCAVPVNVLYTCVRACMRARMCCVF